MRHSYRMLSYKSLVILRFLNSRRRKIFPELLRTARSGLLIYIIKDQKASPKVFTDRPS